MSLTESDLIALFFFPFVSYFPGFSNIICILILEAFKIVSNFKQLIKVFCCRLKSYRRRIRS